MVCSQQQRAFGHKSAALPRSGQVSRLEACRFPSFLRQNYGDLLAITKPRPPRRHKIVFTGVHPSISIHPGAIQQSNASNTVDPNQTEEANPVVADTEQQVPVFVSDTVGVHTRMFAPGMADVNMKDAPSSFALARASAFPMHRIKDREAIVAAVRRHWKSSKN